jgi:hypothetical protein
MVVAVMAMGYVHQHVEIVKSGYGLQKKREELSHLVDQNSKLMYNLFKLESPRNLLASMNEERIEFANYRARRESRGDYRIIAAEPVKEKKLASLIGSFLDIFAVNAEASPRK